MARITPIRISENDRKEHARLVRNARAKVRRTLKNHGVNLEGVAPIRNIDDFATRKEFNEWKEETGSFTNRANLNYQFVTNIHGVTTSKKHINELTRMRKREQRRANEELAKQMDKTISQGGKVYTTVAQRTLHMSVPDVTGVTIPKDFDFKKVRSQSRLKEVEEVGLRRQQPEYYDGRKIQMKENFISLLEQTFDGDSDELSGRLRSMTPDDFYELYISHEEFDFDLYDSEGNLIGDSDGHIEKMLLILDRFDEGISNVNDDLRHF